MILPDEAEDEDTADAANEEAGCALIATKLSCTSRVSV